MEIGGKAKTVPCELKPVNRLRIQLADGHAALYVNEHFCLDRSDQDFHPRPTFNFGCHNHLYPDKLVRISNLRFRRWEPPKESLTHKETPRKDKTSTKDSSSEDEESDEK